MRAPPAVRRKPAGCPEQAAKDLTESNFLKYPNTWHNSNIILLTIAIQLAVGCSAYKVIYAVRVLIAREK